VIRAALVAITACAIACRSGAPPMTKDTVRMKQHLATARRESVRYFVADAVPEGAAVRALAATSPTEPWTGLSDDERFLLYELSPDTRALAAKDQLARAYCAGLQAVPFEWWGSPGALTTETAAHLRALGAAAAPCLRPLLDVATPLRYLNGESNALADQFGWIVGDLAAELAAGVLATDYAPMVPAPARAARRAELARALDALAPR
jgi:hypothetical protein